jgi:AGCS family alanine or glycine:cation symporter
METVINDILVKMGGFLFGPAMLCVYFGVGLMFTIRLGGVQFRRFGIALRECVFGKGNAGAGQIKSIQALATALSSCVGTGNIVGVANAIAVGGPGAIFWMWVAAVLGMATKFAEICLAMHFRVQDDEGNYRGGVMYILSQGMKNKTLGTILGGTFAVFTVFVCFASCGALQANTIASALTSVTSIHSWAVALGIMLIEALVVFGGLKKIAETTSFLTPIMAIIYVGFGLIVIALHISEVPTALWYIVKSAFTGDAAVGGVAGATMAFAIQKGVSRGVFSNEAGVGSSAIIHAVAKVDVPTRQSLYGIIEVFFDTIIVCTITALIIMLSGVWNSGEQDGAVIASIAFTQHFGSMGNIVLTVSLCLFSISTLLGWYTYGESAFVFLFGTRWINAFRVIHMLICASGALVSVALMWNAADACNGLMALPNFISLFLFGGIIVKDTKAFFANYDNEIKK